MIAAVRAKGMSSQLSRYTVLELGRPEECHATHGVSGDTAPLLPEPNGMSQDG